MIAASCYLALNIHCDFELLVHFLIRSGYQDMVGNSLERLRDPASARARAFLATFPDDILAVS